MASKDQIADLINDCWAYFRTTTPNIKTIASWAEELGYLDLWQAGEYIRRKFKTLDEFPKNFPKAVKGFYYEWVRQQPREATGPVGCSMCLDGVLHGVKGGYVYTFRCGHCGPMGIAYREATREWLSDNGYELDWQHDYQGQTDRQRLTQYKHGFGSLDEVPF